MIPDLDLARVRNWLDGRNGTLPFDARDQIRFELDTSDRAITVFECRPGFVDDEDWTRTAICRFRYTKVRSEWSLYWPDGHAKFHLYDQVDATPYIDQLLDEVSADPTGVFWG